MIILIPAKLNSSRLSNKNLRKINNKTLLEISIKFAQSIKINKKIFVSSESQKILECVVRKEIAKFCLAMIPILKCIVFYT